MKNKKKTLILIYITIFALFIGTSTVLAASECSSTIFGDINNPDSLGYWVNRLLNILKWSVPLVVIAFGGIDLFKAVIASKEDEMKKAQSTLIKRIIIAICLFFVPSLVKLLLDVVSSSGADGFHPCYFNF